MCAIWLGATNAAEDMHRSNEWIEVWLSLGGKPLAGSVLLYTRTEELKTL
jgi:hypothetical protein